MALEVSLCAAGIRASKIVDSNSKTATLNALRLAAVLHARREGEDKMVAVPSSKLCQKHETTPFRRNSRRCQKTKGPPIHPPEALEGLYHFYEGILVEPRLLSPTTFPPQP